MSEVSQFIQQARLIRELHRRELQAAIESTPVQRQDQNLVSVNASPDLELSSPKPSLEDSNLSKVELSKVQLSRSRLESVRMPRRSEAQSEDQRKLVVLGTSKIVKELLPSEQWREEVAVFNKHNGEVELSLRVNQEDQGLNAKFVDSGTFRVKLKPFARTVVEVQGVAGPDQYAKKFNAVVFEAKASGRPKQTLQLSLVLQHKRPKLKIVHEQGFDHIGIEGKSFVVLHFQGQSHRTYGFELRSEMERGVRLGLDSAGERVMFQPQELFLGPRQSRGVSIVVQDSDEPKLILLRIKHTQIVYPIKVVIN